MLLDNGFKFLGKELGDYLKIPYLGPMNTQKIFIINTVCDLFMSGSFILF